MPRPGRDVERMPVVIVERMPRHDAAVDLHLEGRGALVAVGGLNGEPDVTGSDRYEGDGVPRHPSELPSVLRAFDVVEPALYWLGGTPQCRRVGGRHHHRDDDGEGERISPHTRTEPLPRRHDAAQGS